MEHADADEDAALDRQAIFDEFRATYGVGLVRQSHPTPVELLRSTLPCKQALIW